MKTVLVFDCNYLCWRAFHSTGQLSHAGEPTGVVYGFLRTVRDLEKKFGADRMVFAFDHGKGLREQHYPWYKETRRKQKLSEEEDAARGAMRQQIEKLKLDYLPSLGYANVWFQGGYEADDIIACVHRDLNWRLIMVSGDKDLYQLLTPRRLIYHPITDTLMDRDAFEAKYGVTPAQWVNVKAIGGCSGDDVPGVPTIGEKTALKFMRGELKQESKAFRAIRSREGIERAMENEKVVRLPYENCKRPLFTKADEFDPRAWDALMEKLGIRTLPSRSTKKGGRMRMTVRRPELL